MPIEHGQCFLLAHCYFYLDFTMLELLIMLGNAMKAIHSKTYQMTMIKKKLSIFFSFLIR